MREKAREADTSIKGLSEILHNRPLAVVGVGSELRGDDAWAYHLISRLKKKNLPGVHCIWGSALPENFIKPIAALKPSSVLVVDSADFGAEPGSIKIFNVEDIGSESFLTHRMPLKTFATIVRERAQCRVDCLFMQPGQLEFAEPLSQPVKKALNGLMRHFHGTA